MTEDAETVRDHMDEMHANVPKWLEAETKEQHADALAALSRLDAVADAALALYRSGYDGPMSGEPWVALAKACAVLDAAGGK